MTYRLLFLMMIVASLVMTKVAQAKDVVLQWNPSTSANVAGYNLYYGTTSGNYAFKVDAGNATSITLSNLTCGATYYFAASAYDDQGEESLLSPEISFIVPGALSMSGPDPVTGLPALNFPVAPGHWYEVQATTDLQNWTSIWESDIVTNNVWTVFQDTNAAAYTQRFYRVVAH